MLKIVIFTLLFTVNVLAAYRCRVGNTLYNCADIYTTSTARTNIVQNNENLIDNTNNNNVNSNDNNSRRNLSRTRILPAHAFAATPDLDALDLSRNNFMKLIRGVFADLRNLKILTIANCSLKEIESGAFDGLKSLQELRLQENNIERITRMSLTHQDLGQLNVLNLSSNLIADIEHHAFDHQNNNMTALETLDLSKNKLQNLQLNMFYDLTALRHLNLQHNLLTQLHPFSFVYLTNLGFLDLSYNYLTTLPDQVFRSSSKILRKIDLSNNNLGESLQSGLFEKLVLLEELDLQRNKLKHLPADAFVGLGHLRRLVLSYNVLEEIAPSLLDPCLLIEDLQMSNNRITFWPSGSGNPFANLKSVRIEGNPWQCPCLQEIVVFLMAKRVSYVDNLYFEGKLPTCVPTAVNVCVRDIDKVKEHQIVEKYEQALHLINEKLKH